MPHHTRLAFEMALHEEEERRALEGELWRLEQAWREAEEIAAIADDLLCCVCPSGVRVLRSSGFVKDRSPPHIQQGSVKHPGGIQDRPPATAPLNGGWFTRWTLRANRSVSSLREAEHLKRISTSTSLFGRKSSRRTEPNSASSPTSHRAERLDGAHGHTDSGCQFAALQLLQVSSRPSPPSLLTLYRQQQLTTPPSPPTSPDSPPDPAAPPAPHASDPPAPPSSPAPS